MAIIVDNETPMTFGDKRRKITSVDEPFIHFDATSPNGRSFKSTTLTTKIPERPHILSEAKTPKQGFNTILAVNVEPTEVAIPDIGFVAPYECIIQYFNRTNKLIRVTDRHNITVALSKPRFWAHNQAEFLIIRKLHRFHNAEIARSVLYNYQVDQRLLSVSDDEREQIIRRISNEDSAGNLRNQNAYLEIIIDRIIPIKPFNEYASIYVSDLDLLFRLEGVDIGTPHPTSQDAVLQGEILDHIGDRRISGAFYEIVDNDSHYSSRYICLGKQLVQIPIHRDPGKEPGIYHTKIDNINVDHLQIVMSHSPLKDSESLGIYSTKEEAETKGHVNESHKLELARLERERTKLEATIRQTQLERDEALDRLQHDRNVEKTTLEHARDRLAHEATIEELVMKVLSRHEQDRLDRLKDQRKDHYEERSVARKDSSEIFKWIPTLATAMITIGTFVVMQRQNSKTSSKGQNIFEGLSF